VAKLQQLFQNTHCLLFRQATTNCTVAVRQTLYRSKRTEKNKLQVAAQQRLNAPQCPK